MNNIQMRDQSQLYALADALDAEVEYLRGEASKYELMVMDAGEIRARIMRAAQDMEREMRRRQTAAARYAAEVERLSKSADRLREIANAAQPVEAFCPPEVAALYGDLDQMRAAVVESAQRSEIEDARRLCGVYFLIDGDEVVYVGQSVNVAARILQHIACPTKQFNRACYVPVHPDELDDTEKSLITLFAPKHNSMGLPRRGARTPASRTIPPRRHRPTRLHSWLHEPAFHPYPDDAAVLRASAPMMLFAPDFSCRCV